MRLTTQQLAEIRERHDKFDLMEDSIDLETMLAHLSKAVDDRGILLNKLEAAEERVNELEAQRDSLNDLHMAREHGHG